MIRTITYILFALGFIPLLMALSIQNEEKLSQKLSAREEFEEIHAGGVR